MVVGVGLAGLVVGLVMGLWLFRLRSRWCPRCGDWTLPHPVAKDDERLIREVVEANDPVRYLPIDLSRLSGADLRRKV
jgi:hypothetical protein